MGCRATRAVLWLPDGDRRRQMRALRWVEARGYMLVATGAWPGLVAMVEHGEADLIITTEIRHPGSGMARVEVVVWPISATVRLTNQLLAARPASSASSAPTYLNERR